MGFELGTPGWQAKVLTITKSAICWDIFDFSTTFQYVRGKIYPCEYRTLFCFLLSSLKNGILKFCYCYCHDRALFKKRRNLFWDIPFWISAPMWRKHVFIQNKFSVWLIIWMFLFFVTGTLGYIDLEMTIFRNLLSSKACCFEKKFFPNVIKKRLP